LQVDETEQMALFAALEKEHLQTVFMNICVELSEVVSYNMKHRVVSLRMVQLIPLPPNHLLLH